MHYKEQDSGAQPWELGQWPWVKESFMASQLSPRTQSPSSTITHHRKRIKRNTIGPWQECKVDMVAAVRHGLEWQMQNYACKSSCFTWQIRTFWNQSGMQTAYTLHIQDMVSGLIEWQGYAFSPVYSYNRTSCPRQYTTTQLISLEDRGSDAVHESNLLCRDESSVSIHHLTRSRPQSLLLRTQQWSCLS